MAQPVTITNVGRDKKVHDDKWFVRVGSHSDGKPRWKTFTRQEWERLGVSWVSDQLKRGQ